MAELILLHYEADDTEVLVNRDQILFIETWNGGAAITLRDGKVVTVKEPLKTVWKRPSQ